MSFTVKAYHGWSDDDPRIVRGLADFALAVDLARTLDPDDYPIVDLIRSGHGVVASRRLVAHPFDRHFVPRDDFGGDS